MPSILLVNGETAVTVSEGEDYTRRQSTLRGGSHDGMHSIGHVGHAAIGLHIVEQVHTEIVETEVGYRHACL